MERYTVVPPYVAEETRYNEMQYRRCGTSGLKLSAVSLGYWHNFGTYDQYENARAVTRRAFDLGITVFDLANNYGPPAGSAEETFGRLMKQDMYPYRDEMVITTKAGYTMWPGPYGDFGSRKYLLSSLDQSLKRMGLDYVDIFYHHRMDPRHPLGRNNGGTGARRQKRQSALCRYFQLQPRKSTRSLQSLKGNGRTLPDLSITVQPS